MHNTRYKVIKVRKIIHIKIVPQETIWERALLGYVSKRNWHLRTVYGNVTYTTQEGRTGKWLFQKKYYQRLGSEKLHRNFSSVV